MNFDDKYFRKLPLIKDSLENSANLACILLLARACRRCLNNHPAELPNQLDQALFSQLRFSQHSGRFFQNVIPKSSFLANSMPFKAVALANTHNMHNMILEQTASCKAELVKMYRNDLMSET